MESESFEKEQVVPVTKAKRKLPIVRIVWVSIAMFFTVVSWGFLISAHIAVSFYANGRFAATGLWVMSYIFALIAVVFYTVDAVCCVVRTVRKVDPLFHMLLAVLLVGAIPLVFFVGAGGMFGIDTLIWNFYHLVCFGMEAVALWRAVRRARKS